MPFNHKGWMPAFLANVPRAAQSREVASVPPLLGEEPAGRSRLTRRRHRAVPRKRHGGSRREPHEDCRPGAGPHLVSSYS